MATTVAASVSPSPSTLSDVSSPSTPSHHPSPPLTQNDHQAHHSKLDHPPNTLSPPKQSDDLPMSDPNESSGQETTKNGAPGGGLAVANPPVRPPPRPFKRANLSLEQNPFEVSFSQSSSSVVRPTSPRANSNNSIANSENDASNHSRNPSDAGPNNNNANPTAGGQKASPKPTLPPLSAIEGPTREGGPSFPWGFSAALNDAGSLRSGPLSPAMLPGPRQDGAAGPGGAASHGTSHGYFDAPTLSFRTGLTPGIGRTGLTPLVGGPASFPPPSPNTAAFLAMVTNPGGATNQQVSQLTGGATITPNTLSALTGTLMQHNAAAAAANGLFLLSQAHQELTKREEQQQQAAAQAEAAAAAQNARGGNTRRASTMAQNAQQPPAAAAAAAGNGHNKRKSGDVSAPTQASRPGGKRARGSTAGTTAVAASPTLPTRQSSRRKKSEVSFNVSEVDSPEQDEMSIDEDDMEAMLAEGQAGVPTPLGGPGRAGQKKFETEEEKRRNFLERNRQAALKCRQRKKAWLTQLQQQVEYLKTENERLQGTIVSMRDEVTRLSAVVVAHRACGLGGVVVPGYASGNVDPHHAQSHHAPHSDRTGSPSSPVVGVAPVSVPVSVPPPAPSGAAAAGQASQG
ncbi:hypothetical protein FRB90_005263, partial [Tulasnella sp. 427]